MDDRFPMSDSDACRCGHDINRHSKLGTCMICPCRRFSIDQDPEKAKRRKKK